MNTRSREIAAGTVLDDRYRVEGVIGYGGFSTVYEAIHVQIGRQVAIKVLDAGLDFESASTATERFLLEAKAAARIDHPNVVAVHDVGIMPSGQPYIVMQCFEGETLHKHLRHHGGMDPRVLLPLFMRCLDGLAVAHQAGIVHRDLKPQNLVLTDPGTSAQALKIIDFGTVQFLDERAQLTAAGHIIGTMAYLPPEYVRHKEVSPSMDVYQMGLVLVEALRGRRLVRGETPLDYARAHIEGRLNIPVALLESPLREILDKALAVRKEDRYPDASHFLKALMAIDPAAIPKVAVSGLATLRAQETLSEDIVVTTAQTMALSTGDIQIVGGEHDETRITPMVYSDNTDQLPLDTQNTAPTPLPPGPGRWSPLLLGIASVIMVLALALVGLLVFRGLQHMTPPTAAAPTPALTSAPIVPLRPAQVKVEVSAIPSSAAMLIDGNHVGQGRATLLFIGEDQSARRVEVRAQGHTTQVLFISPESAPGIEVVLTKSPVEPPAPPVETHKRPEAQSRRPPEAPRQPRAVKLTEKRKAPAVKPPPDKPKPSKKKNWKFIE